MERRTKPEEVLGHEFEESVYEYDEKDVALYALSVGASQQDACDSRELSFTYNSQFDDNFKVLPTFAVLFDNSVLEQLLGLQALVFDPSLLLHGEQFLAVPRPLPPSAKVRSKGRITKLVDKGKAAIVEVESKSFDDLSGELLAVNRTTCVLRGAGGFASSPPAASEPRTKAPSQRPAPGSLPRPHAAVEQRIPQSQALLYRLCGDLNPLHSDPGFAAAAGYPRPILHGLCTLGFATRALLHAFAGDDMEAFAWVQCRFVSHVFPGETLLTAAAEPRAATDAEGRGSHRGNADLRVVDFQCSAKERGTVVLTGSIALRSSGAHSRL